MCEQHEKRVKIADNGNDSQSWYDDPAEKEDMDEGYPIDQYDIIAAPNDFNILTIFNFIESGVVKIPGFQRNFVWDIKRASRLIESLIIGIPVPQIFLYEESPNSFLVIDGQQRLMSVYYFMKQRFPRKEKRIQLRHIFDEKGKIPSEIFLDDDYFSRFKLSLAAKLPKEPNKNNKNKFQGLNYSTLGDYKTAFDLRTIRNIIVKQGSPKDDDSAMYEIFNRLNTGGINLKQQEIRTSIYHSKFYNMLYRLNLKEEWRELLGIEEPDLHMKDVEILLRGFALLTEGAKYNPSMSKFLNGFSKRAKNFDDKKLEYLESLFESFLRSISSLPKNILHGSGKRFSMTLFEGVFIASCKPAFEKKTLIRRSLNADSIKNLKTDLEFKESSKQQTTSKKNVETRLDRAQNLIRVK